MASAIVKSSCIVRAIKVSMAGIRIVIVVRGGSVGVSTVKKIRHVTGNGIIPSAAPSVHKQGKGDQQCHEQDYNANVHF
jgi:hypothetical protein